MGPVPLIPALVAAFVVLAGTATTLHLAIAPDPFAGSAAAVIAVGILLHTTISVTGILIVRGRWARRLAAATIGLDLYVVAVSGMGVAAWVALVAALTALGGLSGRWLDGWFRMRPSATGPDPKAVVLALGLLGLVPAVGIASPSGLETAHGVLGAAGVLLGWAYSKAQVWSLWATRLGLPLVSLPAVLASPWQGGVFLAVLVAVLTWLAWSREAMLAVSPLVDRLPGPRRLRSRITESEEP